MSNGSGLFLETLTLLVLTQEPGCTRGEEWGVGWNSSGALVNLLVASWMETRLRSTQKHVEGKERLRNYIL